MQLRGLINRADQECCWFDSQIDGLVIAKETVGQQKNAVQQRLIHSKRDRLRVEDIIDSKIHYFRSGDIPCSELVEATPLDCQLLQL